MHIALSPLMWVSIWSSRGLYAYWNDPRQFDTHLPVFSFSHCGTLIQFRFLRLEITLDNLKHACQFFSELLLYLQPELSWTQEECMDTRSILYFGKLFLGGETPSATIWCGSTSSEELSGHHLLGKCFENIILQWRFEDWNWNLSCCKIFLVFRFAAMFRTMGTGASPQAFSPNSDLHQQSTLVWHTRTYRKWLLMFCYFRLSN